VFSLGVAILMMVLGSLLAVVLVFFLVIVLLVMVLASFLVRELMKKHRSRTQQNERETPLLGRFSGTEDTVERSKDALDHSESEVWASRGWTIFEGSDSWMGTGPVEEDGTGTSGELGVASCLE
jgi:membrane protein implicated in regulation of membrane protease activity